MNIGDTIEARMRRRLDLSNIDTVMNSEFFSKLNTTPIALAGWQFFVQQKYGSVSSFLAFLKRGAELSLPHSQAIAQVFEDNYRDEIGYFAGKIRNEYAHEEWRLRSLSHFGVEKKNLAEVKLIPELVRYQEIVASLVKSGSFYEIVGALLFWEPFVVREMKALIKALERDLPNLFPKEGYDHSNFPHNAQEYWYSHAEHDVWHFKQIREALQSYLNEHEITEKELAEIQRGMDKVREAKALFYSKALFDRMKSAPHTSSPGSTAKVQEPSPTH